MGDPGAAPAAEFLVFPPLGFGLFGRKRRPPLHKRGALLLVAVIAALGLNG
jgi:hypothetical protein